MKRWFAAAAACAALVCVADDKVAIETLFKVPQYRQMSISPDGKTLAAIAPVGAKQNLVVIDLATKKASAVTSFIGTDVLSYNWVNSKRIAFTTGTLATKVADFRGGALMAADIDGNQFRDLQAARDVTAMAGATQRFTRLVRALPGETDDVIAQEIIPGRMEGAIIVENSRPGDLVRLDTRTGRRTSLGLGKPGSGESESWVVDSRGVARAFTVLSKGTTRIFYRAGADDAWKLLDEGRSLSMTWRPLAIGEDDRTLIVATRKDRDTLAIGVYDPQKRDVTEILAQHPRVDLEDLVSTRDGKVVGVRYEGDRGGTAWFDVELARVQKAVDTAMPDTVNRITWSTDRKRFLVSAHSDVLPSSFFLLDRGTGKLEWLADGAPWIDPKKMAEMRPVRYKARDGLDIPAFLTLPKGGDGKNLPLVVVVHGGPWVPAEPWGYDPEAQFLASRGYAVLQPQFRGTLGLGWKHFSASFKQWGRTMQDDITDGVRWAVDQGIADASRVCIYGASYGGYATMMGLIKDPDLYKCGINYVGVTDLDLFTTATWSDFAQSEFLQYEMKDMFGDIATERDRLMAVSPVEQAAKIKVPVLMAYGAADVRVVPEHGTRMRSALERNNRKVEWMMAEGEGHGFYDPENQKKFYGAMEAFLARHIGDKRN